ncbi:MAG: baseplate J/gp47 family protein [Anaerolineales bacterium]
MKTQIIQLEAHDDTLSVRDKMDWAQAPRVLLVWPEGEKVLRERLDLILLERYASASGSQLALLTEDPEVKFQAGKAGIPIFQTRRDAQLQPWGKSFREFQRQDLQRFKLENPAPDNLDRDPPAPRKELSIWARIPIFTLGVLAVLAVAATLLPTAEITIQSEVNRETLLVPFKAEADQEEIGISGTVPGRELEILVSAQRSIPASGSIPIPTDYAQGLVVFTNLGQSAITIPSGTILSTGGDQPVLFHTLKEASIPPGAGEQSQVEIEAQNPGETGNVAEGQIQLINYQAGAELTVTNPEPTSGGSDLLIPAPTETDRIELSRQIDQILEEKARQQIQMILQDQDLLLSSQLKDHVVVEESYAPGLEAPGDALWLERTVQYPVYYASYQDLIALSNQLVQAQYQNSSFQPLLESIALAKVTDPTEDRDLQFSWQMEISWEEIPIINPDEINPLIQGKPIKQAGAILVEDLGLDQEPDIKTWPGWWDRIPLLPFRIMITTGENIRG